MKDMRPQAHRALRRVNKSVDDVGKAEAAMASPPWSLLEKRLGHPDEEDPLHEWEMPISVWDSEGRDAWCVYAAALGAEFRAPGHDRRWPQNASVYWDFPVIKKMKKSLAQAEALLKKVKADARPQLGRVIADLRAYRDTGRSHGAALEDARIAEFKARQAKRKAARRAAGKKSL